MSQIKVSELPQYTGSVSGSWILLNNPAQTKTYKVLREDFLSGTTGGGGLQSTASGSWTPTLAASNYTINQTSSGKYVKNGNLVVVNGTITVNAVTGNFQAGATYTNVTLTGLPFTCSFDCPFFLPLIENAQGVNSGISGIAKSNFATASLYTYKADGDVIINPVTSEVFRRSNRLNNGAVPPTIQNAGTFSRYDFTISYFTDS